ncbi:hypothetical protein KAR91_44865 [Candidatus Pacearchaeota archaeon]|nr:hypothetical protein [Candidatus Pacearchaeota archaeon]
MNGKINKNFEDEMDTRNWCPCCMETINITQKCPNCGFEDTLDKSNREGGRLL